MEWWKVEWVAEEKEKGMEDGEEAEEEDDDDDSNDEKKKMNEWK